jgi:two-component system chemotaxis response regulator CheY
MKALVAEDDFASRLVIQKHLSKFGDVHTAVNGTEALQAFQVAYEEREPYDLVCLDIMMPGMDGQAVLKEIRALEESQTSYRNKRVIIFMTTALSDRDNVLMAGSLCDAYLVKPISFKVLSDRLTKVGLIE